MTLEFIHRQAERGLFKGRASFRSTKIKRYPYRIHFKVVGDEIRIHSIYHGKRRPGGWKGQRFT
jgi:hypothetical protein